MTTQLELPTKFLPCLYDSAWDALRQNAGDSLKIESLERSGLLFEPFTTMSEAYLQKIPDYTNRHSGRLRVTFDGQLYPKDNSISRFGVLLIPVAVPNTVELNIEQIAKLDHQDYEPISPERDIIRRTIVETIHQIITNNSLQGVAA